MAWLPQFPTGSITPFGVGAAPNPPVGSQPLRGRRRSPRAAALGAMGPSRRGKEGAEWTEETGAETEERVGTGTTSDAADKASSGCLTTWGGGEHQSMQRNTGRKINSYVNNFLNINLKSF